MMDTRIILTRLTFLTFLTMAACDSPGGSSGTTALPTCNNGSLDPGEVCDGALVGSNTCQSAGYERGLLVCNRFCTNFDFAGCNGGSGPGPDTSSPDTISPDTSAPDASTPDTSSPSNQAPNILSLNANTTTLNAGSNLVVTAVVTDPNGIDDLIGGQLEASTGGSYGAFSTAAAEGSYTITLTWDALNTVRLIDAPATGTPLDFKAIFYDVAGARTERTLRVTVRCDATNTQGLCDGECADLRNDQWNCGACNKQCRDEPSFASVAVGNWIGCVESICAVRLRVEDTRYEGGATPRELCTELGLTCPWGASFEADAGNGPNGTIYLSCDERTTPGHDVTNAHCICAPGSGIVNPPDPEPTLATIVGIQSSAASVNCTASSDQLIGAEVTLEAIVTVPRFQLNPSLSGIFVSDGTQNAYSGLLIRFPTAQAYNFTKGQRVRVTGKHYEYFCMTQFAATAMTAIGNGNAPAPRTIAKNLAASELEKWESMAVQLDNVTVTAVTQYNESDTNAGVLIDKFILGTSFVAPTVDTNLPFVRGILGYGFQRYRVSPRDDNDY
jgi:hypothetical protein